jgi:hypothetical protein
VVAVVVAESPPLVAVVLAAVAGVVV